MINYSYKSELEKVIDNSEIENYARIANQGIEDPLEGVNYPGIHEGCTVKLEGTFSFQLTNDETHAIFVHAYLPHGVIFDLSCEHPKGTDSFETYKRVYVPYARIISISETVDLPQIGDADE